MPVERRATARQLSAKIGAMSLGDLSLRHAEDPVQPPEYKSLSTVLQAYDTYNQGQEWDIQMPDDVKKALVDAGLDSSKDGTNPGVLLLFIVDSLYMIVIK
jgi:hypothetical protein